ncbi:MAG: acyl-CoA dehydrogenase family protein [Bacteroidetes bacterium]|nr:acyl-CoA dehydrogenase family protein [Bacteroidota bacterium]MBU2505955.1 acyl-CoA dehydrogenase family protein [Bacteroidota bacterium]
MSDEATKKVLLGGEFLIEESDPQSVFIPEEINEEQKMMVETAGEFVQNEIWPKLDAIDKQEPGLTVSLLDKAGELGLLGTSVPEEYGGLGGDFNTNTFLAMELGTSHSFGVSFAAHTGIGTLPILYYGNDEQKAKYLPKLASGEMKSAYCLTEPTSGSDALSAKTTAKLSDDGKHYILNGQKMWITNGGFADILITFAKVDDDKFTCFIIDTNSPGFTSGQEENKLGIKGSSTRALFLDNVKVPKENILGEIGKGHYVAFNVLNVGRFKLCAMTTGGAKKYASISVQYANERKQFGKSIASFGAIKYKLAEQAIRIFVSESATMRTSGLINDKEHELIASGKSYSEAMIGAAEEYAIEAAMLKVFGSEVLDYVVDETVQIHGGYGYSEEYPAARGYRDSRINRIFEGTNEINRLLTVDMLVKRSMKGRLNLLGPAAAIQKELMSIPEFGEQPTGVLEREMQAIKNAKKAILMIAGFAVQKFMQKLSDEQEIIMNLTDMLIEVFTSESAILRSQKLSTLRNEADVLPYVEMTQTYVNDAINRINFYGKQAIAASAEGDELKLLLLGLKRYTKFDTLNTTKLRRNIADRLIAANRYCF